MLYLQPEYHCVRSYQAVPDSRANHPERPDYLLSADCAWLFLTSLGEGGAISRTQYVYLFKVCIIVSLK